MEIMAYRGKYKPKNPKKYGGDPTNVVYRSMWERHCFKWCDESSKVVKWSSEEVVVPYLYEIDKKYHRYFVDLKITYRGGKTVLIEIKPDIQTRPPKKPDRFSRRYLSEGLTYIKNVNKWKAARSFASDRGWEFEIWTEHTLENMGIKPKSTRALKPLKPLKPLKRPKK